MRPSRWLGRFRESHDDHHHPEDAGRLLHHVIGLIRSPLTSLTARYRRPIVRLRTSVSSHTSAHPCAPDNCSAREAVRASGTAGSVTPRTQRPPRPRRTPRRPPAGRDARLRDQSGGPQLPRLGRRAERHHARAPKIVVRHKSDVRNCVKDDRSRTRPPTPTQSIRGQRCSAQTRPVWTQNIHRLALRTLEPIRASPTEPRSASEMAVQHGARRATS